MKNDNEFKRIISNKNKTQSLEESFHCYFIQQKFDYFINGLTAVKHSIQDKNVKEMWQMWNRLIPID
jgi:hypothetical protein